MSVPRVVQTKLASIFLSLERLRTGHHERSSKVAKPTSMPTAVCTRRSCRSSHAVTHLRRRS
jgi:hypothetical protein